MRGIGSAILRKLSIRTDCSDCSGSGFLRLPLENMLVVVTVPPPLLSSSAQETCYYSDYLGREFHLPAHILPNFRPVSVPVTQSSFAY